MLPTSGWRRQHRLQVQDSLGANGPVRTAQVRRPTTGPSSSRRRRAPATARSTSLPPNPGTAACVPARSRERRQLPRALRPDATVRRNDARVFQLKNPDRERASARGRRPARPRRRHRQRARRRPARRAARVSSRRPRRAPRPRRRPRARLYVELDVAHDEPRARRRRTSTSTSFDGTVDVEHVDRRPAPRRRARRRAAPRQLHLDEHERL